MSRYKKRKYHVNWQPGRYNRTKSLILLLLEQVRRYSKSEKYLTVPEVQHILKNKPAAISPHSVLIALTKFCRPPGFLPGEPEGFGYAKARGIMLPGIKAVAGVSISGRGKRLVYTRMTRDDRAIGNGIVDRTLKAWQQPMIDKSDIVVLFKYNLIFPKLFDVEPTRDHGKTLSIKEVFK